MCQNKAKRMAPGRAAYEVQRKRDERAWGQRRNYDHSYNRRQDVKSKARRRSRILWLTSPEYRARGLVEADPLVLPEPYTGHRWLEMARALVGRPADPASQYADDKWDTIGEAVVALLEGRDMKEAVTAYKRAEYISRYRTVRWGDFRGDGDVDDNAVFERLMPTVESAEDEVMTKVYIETRFNDVQTRRRKMKNKQGQPSNRRSNNR